MFGLNLNRHQTQLYAVQKPLPRCHIPDIGQPIFPGKTRAYGNKTAVINGITGQSYTFSQLEQAIRKQLSGFIRGF
jgi:hypothetical protein